MLDVLPARDKNTLVQWLKAGVESGLLSQVQEVTCDMWDTYVHGPREVLGPGVRITIDRFHVMKNFQERLEDARREIQRQLDKQQAESLKGSRWLWVTNPENLSAQQQSELSILKQKFPELGKLADHREALRQLFDDQSLTDPAVAVLRLKQWCQDGARLGLNALKQFNKTMERWMEKIANYFVSRSSNGRTEGFNRGLRAILWRACGMRNFNHFRLRVLHQFG